MATSALSSPVSKRLYRRTPLIVGLTLFIIALTSACNSDPDRFRTRLLVWDVNEAYLRATDVDCSTLTKESTTNYVYNTSRDIPWDEWWTDLGKVLEGTDTLVLQIVHNTLDRIESDPSGYAADLRHVASQVVQDRAGYAGRLLAVSDCYEVKDPGRYVLYLYKVVPHILHRHESFVRRQLVVADQIEASPQAFVNAARQRIVEEDPLDYSANPQSYAQDLRAVANQIEAEPSAYADFLRSFADRVGIDDPIGAGEYRLAAQELEKPMSFSELFLGHRRLYPHNIVSQLRDAADRIDVNPTYYKTRFYREDLDLLVAAHRGEHGSHAGPFRDWLVFLGFAGH